MKNRKYILKGAGVLLIAAVLIFSTTPVTAETNEENNAVSLSNEQGSTQIASNYGKTDRDYVCWDQYDTDGSNGLSHAQRSCFGYQRALLDDFEIPDGETWVLTDFHMLGLWNTLTPPQGNDFNLSFWSDNAGVPGAEIHKCVTVSYQEQATGRIWFGRPEFEVVYKYEPVTLTEGRYWIWGHIFGPENCFWMARQTIWGTQCWVDYEDVPPLQPGENVFEDDYDLAFQLTCYEPCEPSVDVEKYVWDPFNEEWVDADDPDSAVDLEICTTAKFKIVIHNDGTCCELFEISVNDVMEDSLEYEQAEPPPDDWTYDPPYYYLYWHFPGPLQPCETIEIIIYAHVVGEHCTIDYNMVKVGAYSCEGEYVTDEDYAYVHAIHMPKIDVHTVTKGLGVKAIVENTGCQPATNVKWEIKFTGGLIIFPPGGVKSGNLGTLASGASATIRTCVLGLGRTTIDIHAKCAEGPEDTETISGFVILFFVL